MIKISPEVFDLFRGPPKWQRDWEMWALRKMGEELNRQTLALVGVEYLPTNEPEPEVPPLEFEDD